MGKEVNDAPANGAQLQIWRAFAVALMTFILGNGVAFVVFGIHAASKSDLADAQHQLSDRMGSLEARDATLEATVNQLLGEMRAKGIDRPGR